MAIPKIETLLPMVEQKKLTVDEFLDKLTAIMGDADAVQKNYRGAGLFSFYVEGRLSGDIAAEQAASKLRDAGYHVHRLMGTNGYMPPPHIHNFTNVDWDTPDVIGFPQFEWTHVQISGIPVA